MKSKRKLDLEAQTGDMTSMIDIVFLLLIFFILMPFKSVESRLESHLPKFDGIDPKKSEKIDKIDVKIKLDKNASVDLRTFSGVTVAINGQKISSFLSLKNKLTEMKESIQTDKSKIPLELNADEDVPFYFILKALDFAKLNEFTLIKYPALIDKHKK
jgi:biopolymer transport protein ExbD